MKRLNSLLYFLSAFIVTGSILCFAALPLRLHGPIWQGYRVLAVPASEDMEIFISAVEQAGISGTVSELSVSNRFSFLAPGIRNGFPFTDTVRYGQWFKDETASFRYFYIPYYSLFRFLSLYFSLYRTNRDFYLEAALPYSLLKGCLALVFFIYCVFGSRKKILFLTAASSFVFYAFCVRSSLSLTTALLSMLSTAYWIEAFESEIAIPWKQLKERIRCNVFMIVLPVVSFLSAIIDGFVPLLFFLLAIILSAAAMFSVYSFLQIRADYKDKYRLHPSLKIFVMHPQSWSLFWNTRYALTATVLSGVLLLIAAVLPLVFSVNRLDRSIKGLSIPHPLTRYTEPLTDSGFFTAQMVRSAAALPDLSNYIQDCWYTAAMPYMNVHEPLQPLTQHAQIRFDFFNETDGKLYREEKILYEFNTEFIMKALQYDFFALLPLEKMLLQQGGFTPAVYRTVKIASIGKLPAFFISLIALLFPCILIIIAKIR